jgi:hypothetical protein
VFIVDRLCRLLLCEAVGEEEIITFSFHYVADNNVIIAIERKSLCDVEVIKKAELLWLCLSI